jgi:hypothetical protein
VILNTIVNCFTVRLGLGGLADNQIDTSCLHSMHRTPPEARSHDISQTASTVRTPEHGRDAAPYCSLPIDEHYSFQIVFDQNGHQWPSLVIDGYQNGHRLLSRTVLYMAETVSLIDLLTSESLWSYTNI